MGYSVLVDMDGMLVFRREPSTVGRTDSFLAFLFFVSLRMATVSVVLIFLRAVSCSL